MTPDFLCISPVSVSDESAAKHQFTENILGAVLFAPRLFFYAVIGFFRLLRTTTYTIMHTVIT